ncbi:MAG TPA: hypothetical protein VLF09_13155 [Cellvibrio sp.]|nr:hypothetical protein [Cellvibrio sp.]
MKNTLISTLALSLLMVGCGGGSSSSPKTSSSSSVVNSVAPSSTATSSTSAVANSQASSLAALATGVFLDGAVANIGYRTATQQGSTNSNGEFNYRPGESVTFFIGNLELPAVLAGAIITPMEIANTTNLSDNQLINILRLLQSLDADGNAANGIEITAAAIAAGAVLDFTVAPEVFAQLPAVKELLQAAGSPNKELISAEQARAHFETTLEFINGPASSSASSVAETSSSANSETVVTSSSASSETVVVSSSGHTSSVDVGSSASSANSSDDVIIVPGSSASSASTSSSNASSAAPAETQTIWNVYNANHHPAANGSVTLADGSATQFTLGNTADYFNAFNGSVNLDTSTAGSLTSGASIANVVNADGVYPKYFTLIAGITGNGDGLRVLELEVAMADSAKAGSRLKTILRNDGTNKGVQLESANNGASANSYGLNMNTFGIYQIAVTLTDATTGSVRVYRDGQLLPAMSLNNVTMRATSAAGDNFLRFGEVSGSAAYKSTVDWMVWTNQGAFSPDDLSGELPADLGCVYGYGGSNNTVTCANPPATSSSSAANSSTTDTGSSSSAASSIDYGNADVRAPKMEGFAAYAGVTGGAGGPVITVTTGTELNAALCGARTKNNPTPVTILVNGTINHANTTAQGCNTQADVIEIKQTANVSIIGVGTNALFDQIGIHVRESSNVIIQNVHVRNVKKSGSPTSNGGDAIGLESKVDRVWIDHNWLEASGGEKDGYDSLLDMKSGVTNVTVSYNKFNDSSRAGLVGFTDSDVNNNITFHHNWYKNIEQRTPLIRNALVHVYNNYWSNESIDHMFHAVNSRAGAKALVESNYFYNVNNPLIASDDSDTPGCWQTNNDNTVLPYIYYSRTVGNGALVVPTIVDGQLQSTCAVTVPYTVQMDAANDVPAIVMANVGTGKIGNGGASSSSSQSSTVVVESSSSIAQSSSSVGSSETVVTSSNSSASSVNSSEQSEASSSAAPGASVFYSEDFSGATASNFYTTYRVNGSGQSLYKKSGGTPVFADGTIGLTGARFTIGEAGKDLDLSKAYRLSFDVVQVSGSGKVQIFVDNASTSGTTIFNQAANTLAAGQRLVVNSSMGTAASFIQIRAESSATLVLDNLTIEYTDANPSSSAASTSSAANNSSAGNVSSANSSASISSVASSSSSSAPYIPPSVNLSADCIRLATDASVNWRDTSLKTDQEIVACLSQSLGKPVGYGENAKGGFDPNGNSKLTIITKNSSVSVEQQLLDAITGEAHNWIVFDKVEFAQPHEIGMYRLGCSNPTVQSILGATEAECVNYTQWCANNGVSSANCVAQFFNTAMNKSNNPIRNPVIGSNKTIDGRMSEAYFLFSGFAIGKDSTGTPTQTANSVIMTHLRFKGAGHTEDHYCDPDMIRSTGASKDIWIHKNTFDTTGDSAFDVKVGAHNVTMSFNRLVNVKRAVLHGSSDSHTIDTQITTTMHHNQFVTTDDSYMLLGNTLRRVPLLRHGKTHMFNNVFVNYRKEILSLRVGASAFMEDSVFVVNSALQEKSSVAASLAEISTNYFKDISDGYFRNDRNFLWFGSASCDLDNTTKTALTATNGTVADLSQNYSADSLNMINGWRFEAGQELVDYLSATAGKYGQVPFNSPLSGDRYYVAGLGKVSCQ